MNPSAAALNLVRRLPPEEVEQTYYSLICLREDLADTLLNHMDFPFKTGYDSDADKAFIQSDFNNCDSSYRWLLALFCHL